MLAGLAPPTCWQPPAIDLGPAQLADPAPQGDQRTGDHYDSSVRCDGFTRVSHFSIPAVINFERFHYGFRTSPVEVWQKSQCVRAAPLPSIASTTASTPISPRRLATHIPRAGGPMWRIVAVQRTKRGG